MKRCWKLKNVSKQKLFERTTKVSKFCCHWKNEPWTRLLKIMFTCFLSFQKFKVVNIDVINVINFPNNWRPNSSCCSKKANFLFQHICSDFLLSRQQSELQPTKQSKTLFLNLRSFFYPFAFFIENSSWLFNRKKSASATKL